MFGIEVLKLLNFQFEHLLYGTANVQIYSGTYNGFPSVFKVLPVPPNVNFQELEKESQILLRITHENIVKIYNYEWVEWNAAWYLVIVMEACDKDLAKDMAHRRENRYPYSEAELWHMVTTLVRTFAYMQRQGLAHRDIKPGNIFLSHGTLKVGDFGSARYLQIDLMTATLVGTPFYLSPILKQGLASRQRQVAHNVYKSDVYSLGLTLLVLATLQPPLSAIQGEDAKLTGIVCALNYSDHMKQMILWMTSWDEANRPDFVELESWTAAAFYPQLSEIPFLAPEQSLPPEPATSVPEAPVIEPLPVFPVEPENPIPPAIDNVPITMPEKKKFSPRGKSHKVQREEEKKDSPKCLFCKKPIRITSGSIVQLKCSPNSHVYCSRSCFIKDVNKQLKEKNKAECILCKVPIEDDDLLFYKVKGLIKSSRKSK